jgi:epoxyqueuosine reductase
LNILTQKIKAKAKELGFYDCGISRADLLKEDAEKLGKWIGNGMQAGMHYMENHFEKRTDPRLLFENAKSVISVLYNYYPKTKIQEENNYKISKYAYGKDYHQIIKQKLNQLIEFVRTEAGEINARAFTDSAPVLDRAWAARAGLGWIGKNTNLINRKQGSFFFIGEIISDLELDYDGKKIENFCGTCTKCIDACPTGALKPYEVDARKCISYLTIENKEEYIPSELKGRFDDWIFGCDICQDVCPWNRFSKPHDEPAFDPPDILTQLRKPDWNNLTEEQFRKVFKDSPVKRSKYKGLIRNIRFVNLMN